MTTAIKTRTATTPPSSVIDEIKSTLEGLQYGSVEVYVCHGEVVQITKRSIKKMKKSECCSSKREG